ncbi:hypothetical protein HC256_006664 [Beauveria bassiana]|nr:hypothetical protein HC256_006664 [Beauveria bassiana]
MKAELFFQIPVASTVGLVLSVFGIWKYRLPQLVLDGTLLAAVGEGLCLWSTRSKGVRSGTTVSANKGAVLITCRFCSGVVVIVLLPLARRLQVYVLVPLILTQVCQSLIHCLAIWNKMQSDKKNKELASNYFRTPSYASIEEGQMLFFRDPLIFGAKNQLVCLGFPHAPGLKAGEALLMLLVSSLMPRCRVKWGPFKTERMPHDARSNSPRTMNNIEITTPETFKIDPAGPPKRRHRNNKPPSHILRASRRTRGFRWPGENDVTIARRVLDRIKSNPIPVKMTIHDDITRLIALLGSVESAERPFFQAHVALVLDIAISEQWLDLDQGNTARKQDNSVVEIRESAQFPSHGEIENDYRKLCLRNLSSYAKGQFTDSDFAYIESIRDGRPVNCQEYEQLSPVNLGPALCRKLTAADIEKALRPPKSTSRGDKAKKSHPTAEEAAVQISPLDPMPRDSQQSIPLYGMFRLYPAPDDSQFSKQQEQLKRKHDDARAEIMERKLSADHTLEKSKYPACTDFMAEVVGYLDLDMS